MESVSTKRIIIIIIYNTYNPRYKQRKIVKNINMMTSFAKLNRMEVGDSWMCVCPQNVKIITEFGYKKSIIYEILKIHN